MVDKTVDLARSLMTEHGLGFLQFGFASELGKSGLAAGMCSFKVIRNLSIPYKITLSLPWVRHLPVHKIREIIMHEIAHALCPSGTGHGLAWQTKMLEFGLEPNEKFWHPTVPKELMKYLGNSQKTDWVLSA